MVVREETKYYVFQSVFMDGFFIYICIICMCLCVYIYVYVCMERDK